jgi:hypothetical protein
VAELEPDEKVRWIRQRSPIEQWAGNSVTWQLTSVHNGTRLVFTHEGVARVDEKYAWTHVWWEHFLASLKSYLQMGKGTPGFPRFVQRASTDLADWLGTGREKTC